MDITGTCCLCLQDFKKFRKPVLCSFCPENIDQKTCMDCTQDYLLSSQAEAHCMNCKHAWPHSFMHKTFPDSFLTNKYRKNRQKIMLENQKSLLPATLHLVEVEKQKLQIKKDIAKIEMKKKKLIEEKRKLDAQIKMMNNEIRVHRNRIRSNIPVNVKKYVGPCPAKSCRGFIEEEDHKCGVCDLYVCRKCHEPLTNEEAELKKAKKSHKCDENSVESVKALMADTKPCPKCKTRIFKIEGCDQMFCTSCKTPFSWNTGEIVKGVIHNPHYYEMLRATGAQPRNPGDNPCGGLPNFYVLNQYLDNRDYYASASNMNDPSEFMVIVHRRTAEIQDYVENKRRNEAAKGDVLEQTRLKFLLKQIKTDKEFQSTIFREVRKKERTNEELQILDTFLAGVIERFNNFIAEAPTTKSINKLMNRFMRDTKKIIEFCNKAFVENFSAMEYKSFPQIVLDRHYIGKKFTSIVKIGEEPPLVAKKRKVVAGA